MRSDDIVKDRESAVAEPEAIERLRAKAKGSKKSKPRRAKAAHRPTESKAGGTRRPYPRATLEEALRVPVALKEKNGGNPWPPGDIAAAVGLSYKNPDFFYLAAASRDFGFTEGSRDSELISLTEFGRDVVYAPSQAQEEAKLREALLKVDIFRKVLDYYKGANLPEMQYLGNTLSREFNLNPDFHEEFSRLFRENCAYLKIGSGFSSDQTSQTQGRNNAKPSDGASTVVLAEPKGETGLIPTPKHLESKLEMVSEYRMGGMICCPGS